MAKDALKEERMKILDLLSKGTITAEQAENLLGAMGEAEERVETEQVAKKKTPFRMLKILVDSADGDEVRVELPIEFAKLLKSKRFNIDSLNDTDIDIDQLIEMVNSGVVGEIVNVKSADGDIVKIVVE
ncbi:MAG: hypothetical protein JXB20_00180 [Bacilli bacterium]|nr:hypothetical protein [Bacilli bacterium]MBN2696210.1 hypothetical protein [Bacilli bacterium]